MKFLPRSTFFEFNFATGSVTMEQIFAIVGPIQQSLQEIQQEFQQNGERLDSLQAEIQNFLEAT
jgi:hypothetical protein